MTSDEIEAELQRLIDELLAATDIRRAVTAVGNLDRRIRGFEPPDPEDEIARWMMHIVNRLPAHHASKLIVRAYKRVQPKLHAKAEREEAERKVKARREAQREWFQQNIGRHF